MSESNGNGYILDAQGITKQFGGLTAVSDVSFTLPERSIVSIIGPNGAGKTTFFNMLTGFYRPTIAFSVAVIVENRRMFWNVRAIPSFMITSGRPPVIPRPSNVIRPIVGR